MMDVETSNIDTGTEKPVFLPTVRVSASGLRVSFPLQYSGSFSGTVLIFRSLLDKALVDLPRDRKPKAGTESVASLAIPGFEAGTYA